MTWTAIAPASGSASITTLGTVTTGTWNATTIGVPYGGTGDTSLTAHGVLLGEGASAVTALTASAAGTVLQGNGTAADPTFSAVPVLGVNGTTTGQLNFATSVSSGASITVQNGGATAAYNFNLPTSAGTAGQLLTSQAGGSNAMTWTSLPSTATSNLNSGQVWVGNGSNISTAVTPTGDMTISSTGATTVGSVDGVSYPTSPSTNTVPVVTSSNTVTYEAVPVGAGGTGQSSVLTADGVVYASSTTAMATTAAGTSGQVLTSNGAGNGPTWQTLGAFAPVYTAGNWYQAQTNVTSVAGAAMVAGTTYFYPIFIQRPVTIEAIGFQITTAAAGTAYFNVGIYSNSSGQPSARLAAGAGSNSTSTGATSLTLNANYSVTTPGWYWLAFQAADTSMRNQSLSSNGNGASSILGQNLGSTNLSYILANSITGYCMTGTAQSSAGYANITMPATTSGLSFTNGALMPLTAYQLYSVP
jgi:hypothetical protein